MIKVESEVPKICDMKSTRGVVIHLYKSSQGIEISCYKSNGNPNTAVLNRIYDQLEDKLRTEKMFFSADELVIVGDTNTVIKYLESIGFRKIKVESENIYKTDLKRKYNYRS